MKKNTSSTIGRLRAIACDLLNFAVPCLYILLATARQVPYNLRVVMLALFFPVCFYYVFVLVMPVLAFLTFQLSRKLALAVFKAGFLIGRPLLLLACKPTIGRFQPLWSFRILAYFYLSWANFFDLAQGGSLFLAAISDLCLALASSDPITRGVADQLVAINHPGEGTKRCSWYPPGSLDDRFMGVIGPDPRLEFYLLYYSVRRNYKRFSR